jgi:hypothetical protein
VAGSKSSTIVASVVVRFGHSLTLTGCVNAVENTFHVELKIKVFRA